MTKKDTKRVFGSGAYRDTDDTKLQYRRCLSHRVLKSFAEFMRKHNTMADGARRNEENWKKGFPQESFMDSKFRHFMYSWEVFEESGDIKELIESLNAELFNVMGWLDLLLRPGMTIDKFRKSMEEIIEPKIIEPKITAKSMRKIMLKLKKGRKKDKKRRCGNCKHFKLVSKYGQKPSLDCEIVGYGTRVNNNPCDRFEQRKEKKVHYLPLNRAKTKQGTTCGLIVLGNLKTTPHKYHVKCKTCEKIINREIK